jgi:A/G-specific adenine glycosylase
MITDFNLQILIEPLLNWFAGHARVLPWREEPTPYRVWVSEIMLQQTRVEAVKPYFERFTKRLPDVEALAECPEDELLKLWEGLGYYNRVRNMQKAAIQVMEAYGGKLPADYEELLKLKGIGSYTAGAIASIAYQIPVPAVDGNVFRVLTRVAADDTDIMKPSFRTLLEKELREVMHEMETPGAFNQALMELGWLPDVITGASVCRTVRRYVNSVRGTVFVWQGKRAGSQNFRSGRKRKRDVSKRGRCLSSGTMIKWQSGNDRKKDFWQDSMNCRMLRGDTRRMRLFIW